MSKPIKNQRRFSRVPLALTIDVEISKSRDEIQHETGHLKNVSPVGAGFNLDQEVEVGQLLLLKMPLPRQFRGYDFTERQYRVWGIVRHCEPVEIEKNHAYFVGVAFIGKDAPPGYAENPLTFYHISKIKNIGFCEITEDTSRSAAENGGRKPRYTIPINIYIAVYDENDIIAAHEKTVTENISPNGASVFSSLPVNVGDRVSFICEQNNVSLSAEVRNVRIGADGLPRLHLKFIGEKFPLQGIERI